jgi:hypothetical protein
MGFDVQALGELEVTPPALAAQIMTSSLPHMSAPRFDWYGATVPNVSPQALIAFVKKSVWGIKTAPKQQSRLKNSGYRKWETLGDEHGACAQVHWEGSANNPHARIDVWGPHTPQVAARLRQQHPHFTTRLDVSCDTEETLAFVIYKPFLEDFAASYNRVLITQFIEETKGDEKASTFYVGSKNSEVRLCLYEKGKMRGYEDHPNLVRIELRLCMESLEDQKLCSALEPEQAWGLSAWSTLLAPHVLCAHVPRCPRSKKHGNSTTEQKAGSCAKSYGPHFDSFSKLAGGAESMGPWLMAMYQKQQLEKASKYPGKYSKAKKGSVTANSMKSTDRGGEPIIEGCDLMFEPA